jgi:hypothetical protein
MDLTRYVDELREGLLIAAEAGGADARLLAERLVAPLQSAARLVLLDALSAAAGEITSELAPGSVEVRLRGRDPEFVVTSPILEPGIDDVGRSPEPLPSSDRAPAGLGDVDEGATSRVTLRLPEPLKARIEEAAARNGVSVNAWLVRTLAGALNPPEHRDGNTRQNPSGGARFKGWARS